METMLKQMPIVTVLAILLCGTSSAEWKIACQKVQDDDATEERTTVSVTIPGSTHLQ